MSFYNRIDPVLINKILPGILGDEQVGVYAQAYRLLDAGQNFAFLFAVLLLPIFANMLKNNQQVEKLVKLSGSLIITGSLIIAIAIQFYSVQIMQLMYNIMPNETQIHYIQRINQSSTILSLLMFSFVAISSNYIFGTLLTANNSLKTLNIIAVVGLLINLAFNLIFIPHYYAIGSAYASLATQVITAILQLYVVYKIFKFQLNYKLIFSLVSMTVVLYIIGYLLNAYTAIVWYFSMSIILVLGLIIAFALKLINIKEFILIIKNE